MNIEIKNNKINNILKEILSFDEITFLEINSLFKEEETTKKIINILKENEAIIEIRDNNYLITEKAKIFQKKYLEQLEEKIKEVLKDKEEFGEYSKIVSWEDLESYLKKFTILKSKEGNIYEFVFCINGKEEKIELEGKEILDCKTFILKFFEKFGIVLESYKGLQKDWGNLLTYFYQKHAIIEDKVDEITPLEEAKETLISYIESCMISEEYVVREGIVIYKNECIFVPNTIIKKILKRNDLNISLKSLAYYIREYIISKTIPIKIENRSERFWRFNPRKLNIDLSKKTTSEEI